MKTTLKYLVIPAILLFVIQLNGCKEEEPEPPATIAGFTPASGKIGSTVTITGSHFETTASSNNVKFNGVQGVVTSATATEIKVTVPEGATTGKITVSVRDATTTSETDFTVVIPPTITSFSPNEGVFGDEIIITGSDFSANATANIVTIGDVAVKVVTASETQLKVKLDKGGKTGKISVTVNDLVCLSDDIFHYTPKWVVSTFAGSGNDGSADGTGVNASFSNMTNIDIDDEGNVYMADELNNLIRKITPQGVVTTVVGKAGEGWEDGPIAQARFYMPVAVAVDTNGDLYVADSFNQIIRKVSASNQMVTTVAGTGYAGADNGDGDEASFNNPHGVCVDSHGNLFIADNLNNKIRKITPDGTVSTFVGSGVPGSDDGTGTDAEIYNPWALCIDKDDNIYIADTFGNKIRKVTPEGVVSTLAGADELGWVDGQGSEARFNRPTGVSVDQFGNVFVVEHLNSTVRKITPEGVVTTIAGTGEELGYNDGFGEDALFHNPYSVTNNPDGTILYITDVLNRRLRKMEFK